MARRALPCELHNIQPCEQFFREFIAKANLHFEDGGFQVAHIALEHRKSSGKYRRKTSPWLSGSRRSWDGTPR
jgi:hypothetical protein